MGPSADLSTPAAAQKQLKFQFVRKEDLCECACHRGKSLLLHFCCYCLTCRSSYSTYKKQGAPAKRKYQVKKVNKYETRCECQTCCLSEGLLVHCSAFCSATQCFNLVNQRQSPTDVDNKVFFLFCSNLLWSFPVTSHRSRRTKKTM